MKQLIPFVLLLSLFSFSLSADPINVYSVGYEEIYTTLCTVAGDPDLVTINYAYDNVINKYNNPTIADMVEIWPQSSSITDLYFAVALTTNATTVWKTVGSIYSMTDNLRRIDAMNSGIDGITLKKTTGSTVVGVSFFKRSKNIN